MAQTAGPVRHGLESMTASGPKEASLFWLQALKGEDGPVSLMRPLVSADGKEIRGEELDRDVCSCCPTYVVNTTKGLLVAYRDQTRQDILDIGILRFDNGPWSDSKILHADKWQINACPVNAASAAAKGSQVAMAWNTEADDTPRVQLAFSSDSGLTFGKPTGVSTRDTLGYASTALNSYGGALVSWIEEGVSSARALVRLVSPAGAAGPVLQVAGRLPDKSGIPEARAFGKRNLDRLGRFEAGVKTAQLK